MWPWPAKPHAYVDRRLVSGSADHCYQHTKIVIADAITADAKALVTSANFSETAQRHNFEAGWLTNQSRGCRRSNDNLPFLLPRVSLFLWVFLASNEKSKLSIGKAIYAYDRSVGRKLGASAVSPPGAAQPRARAGNERPSRNWSRCRSRTSLISSQSISTLAISPSFSSTPPTSPGWAGVQSATTGCSTPGSEAIPRPSLGD